ncbi:MAG: iron ABC transporter permease [Dehalococcoidia bacterium]|jgi:iron(III) transport system permease protein|nr:iron ABC transporter permease [Dehalococcoidia bacterium]
MLGVTTGGFKSLGRAISMRYRFLLTKPGRPPVLLLLAAGSVAAVLLLSPSYLLIRTLGAGPEAWDLLIRIRVLEILGRTLLLVGVVTGASILLAIPLAWLTVRTDLPFKTVWSVATALPLVIPSYVAGFIVVVTLGPKGMLQGLMEGMFGLERLPDISGFPGAALTLTLLSYPYVLLTVRAAFFRLDPSLEEISRGLGRNPWATFFGIILPSLRPAIAAGGLLVALYTLADFGAVSLLRFETFTWAIFLQYESALDRGLAAALSLVLIAIALALVGGEAFTRGRWRYYRSGSGASRPLSPVRLGRWRWPALGLCAAVVMASLVLPMSVLVYWVFRGVSAGEPLLLLWEAARNSVYVSAIAAGASVAAALPIAALSVRFPGMLSGILERIAYIGFALPGIAIALSLVFFGVNYAPLLYQTTGLLVLGYVVLFVSAAVGAARSSFLQVSPNVEEAARGLGRTPLGVFASVTLPLVRPGIVSGAALVFLLTMKELPATLILSPIGFQTLATSIWSAASEAFFAQAAAPALLLILTSSVPLAFLLLRSRQ